MAPNPIVLITGGNTGLGLEIVKALSKSSKAYTILLGGRSIDKANAAAKEVQTELPSSVSTVKTIQIDIEDDDSISNAFKKVSNEYGCLDVLINNAGSQFDQHIYSGKLTMREAWNQSWNANTTSTHIFTHTFVPLLLRSSDPKLLFITSGTATLAESNNTAIKVNLSPEKGWPKEVNSLSAYRSSKTGLNMVMREWRRILQADGVKVWAVSPGLLATGLGGNPELLKQLGALDPAIGGNLIREVVEGARDQDVGQVVRRGGIQPW